MIKLILIYKIVITQVKIKKFLKNFICNKQVLINNKFYKMNNKFKMLMVKIMDI